MQLLAFSPDLSFLLAHLPSVALPRLLLPKHVFRVHGSRMTLSTVTRHCTTCLKGQPGAARAVSTSFLLLLVTSASLVTSALLVVTKSY